MACDATARLYDVDEDSVVFTKLQRTEKYDQGTVAFRARKGKLIDLDQLHESIWATRLSGGTRSGLVSLEVVAIGEAVKTQDGIFLRVRDSDSQFILAKSDEHDEVFDKLLSQSEEGRPVQVSGRIDNYFGRWPSLFQRKLKNPRQILVTSFETVE